MIQDGAPWCLAMWESRGSDKANDKMKQTVRAGLTWLLSGEGEDGCKGAVEADGEQVLALLHLALGTTFLKQWVTDAPSSEMDTWLSEHYRLD